MTKDEAKRYLSDTAPEQCFWVNHGPVLKNLIELEGLLPQISDETFRHHVNSQRNDFSNWIRDVLGDKKLANDLMSSKSRESAAKKVRERLNSLKKKTA